ncbi:MAG: hypothetical protein HY319_02575 [Armatimonadetes bacterium]|nr:hypothetical protein [Armatimonadota bacterium]
MKWLDELAALDRMITERAAMTFVSTGREFEIQASEARGTRNLGLRLLAQACRGLGLFLCRIPFLW